MKFRNLSEMVNEIICDNILRKFEDNQSIEREKLKERGFYENLDPDYAVVEDHINYLITDRTLKENGSKISLTTKGWFILTNADKVGYVAQKIESIEHEMSDNEARFVFKWAAILAVFIIGGWLAYRLLVMEPQLAY
jgi:hypothetical protein